MDNVIGFGEHAQVVITKHRGEGFSGVVTGEALAVIGASVWENLGKMMQSMRADSEYHDILSNAATTQAGELVSRGILVSIDL